MCMPAAAAIRDGRVVTPGERRGEMPEPCIIIDRRDVKLRSLVKHKAG